MWWRCDNLVRILREAAFILILSVNPTLAMIIRLSFSGCVRNLPSNLVQALAIVCGWWDTTCPDPGWWYK